MLRRFQEWRCRRASERALDEHLVQFPKAYSDTQVAALRGSIRRGPHMRRDRRSWGYQKMCEMVKAWNE